MQARAAATSQLRAIYEPRFTGGGGLGQSLRSHPEQRCLCALALATALWLAFAAPARAQRELVGELPFEVTADEIEYDSVRNVYVANGRVHIHHEKKRLSADWVVFSQVTGAGTSAICWRYSAASENAETRGPDR